MSQVIAIVQMDACSELTDQANSDHLHSQLLKHFTLLSYCQNVSHWGVIVPAIDSGHFLHKACTTALVSRLDEPLPGEDALDTFHRVADRLKEDDRDNDGSVTVARLVPGEHDPDPARVDAAIAEHLRNEYDYSSLHIESARDWTLEVMQYESLLEAWQEALLPDDRCMITPYIYRQQLRLNLGRVCQSGTIAN